ncbi:MAG: glycine oxidase ThiO [Pirellulaceae bacterium]
MTAAKSDRTSDILIVGGGIMGLSLAWELSQRGHEVSIAEAASIGRGQPGASSWAGAGILPPAPQCNRNDPFEELQYLSQQTHQKWAESLLEKTGIDTGFRKCGGIHLARTPGEKATLVGNESWWSLHGIEYERLDASELEQLEPKIALHLAESSKTIASTNSAAKIRGWRLPGESQLRNPDHLRALRCACERSGVSFLQNSKVVEIESKNVAPVSAVLDNKTRVHASLVAICSGAWSREFLDRMEIPNGLMPVRGQMLLYHPPQALLTHVLNEGNRYLVPRVDNRLLVGSVEEEVGFQPFTTEEALGQLAKWATSILPELAELTPEQSWAGLRPGSFDGLPYIGAVPGHENLFIAAGHFRNGLYLSTGTALCLANVIEKKSPPLDLTPFRLARG